MQVQNRIELQEIVFNLRKHAAESPVFSAMAHVFALRERTRQQIVLTTLFNTMVKEGFKFTKDEYRKELDYMGNIGLGKVYKDSKGRTVALRQIGVTLQSVGLAAVSKQDTLAKLKIANKFVNLPPIQPQAQVQAQPQARLIPKPQPQPQMISRQPTAFYKATLVIDSDGKRREISLANKLTAEKLLDVITTLQEKS